MITSSVATIIHALSPLLGVGAAAVAAGASARGGGHCGRGRSRRRLGGLHGRRCGGGFRLVLGQHRRGEADGAEQREYEE